MEEIGGTGATLHAKFALGLATAAALLLVGHALGHQRWRIRLDRISSTSIGVGAVVLATLTVLLVLVVGYGVLGVTPRGDAVSHYYPQAKAVLEGGIPYVDFPSSYGLLFPYLNAVILAIHDDPISIIVATQTFHVLSLAAVVYYAVRIGKQPSPVVLGVVAVYLLHSAAIWYVGLTGSNQSWVALLYAITLIALSRNLNGAAGAMAFLPFALVKAIALIGAPSLFGYSRHRRAFAAGFAALALLFLGMCVALDVPPLGGLLNESDSFTSSNLPYFATLFGFDLLGLLRETQIAAFVVLALAALWLGLRAPPDNVAAMAAGGSALLFTFMLVSPKAFTVYVVMMQVPVSLWLGHHMAHHGVDTRLVVYALVMVCAGLDVSAWFTVMQMGPLSWVWTEVDSERRAAMLGFLAMQATLVGGYAYLAVSAYRDFERLRRCAAN